MGVNIFYLDRDPVEAAKMQCDRHVVKMILETAQLLSTAHHVAGEGGPYKVTHKNHPSAVWARQSTGNYQWLYSHLRGLSEEYTRRYGKVHKTWLEHRQALLDPPAGVPVGPFTEPPQCMPDDCKRSDAILAYMIYYNVKADEWEALGRPMTWKS